MNIRKTNETEEKRKAICREALAQDRQKLLMRWPFIGGILMRMELVPVRDDRLDTASTNGDAIFVDIDFYAKLTAEQRLFVLAHEVWHCVLLHFARKGGRDRNLFNIAADLEIHFTLLQEKLSEPWVLPHEANWASLSAEEIYERLKEKAKDDQGISFGSQGKSNEKFGDSSSSFDKHIYQGDNQAEAEPEVGGGAGGAGDQQDAAAAEEDAAGGAGAHQDAAAAEEDAADGTLQEDSAGDDGGPQEDSGRDDDGPQKDSGGDDDAPREGAARNDGPQKDSGRDDNGPQEDSAGDDDGPQEDSGEGDDAPQEEAAEGGIAEEEEVLVMDNEYTPWLSSDAVERARSRAIASAQQVERVQGTLPAHIESLINRLKKPQLRWQELLKQFLTSCYGGNRRWLPPSRRHVWHNLYLPSMRTERLKAVVALDTSGSTQGDLEEFFSELTGLLNSFGNYELTILQCDAEIQKVEHYSEAKMLPPKRRWEARGGGGTSFLPVFDYVEAHLEERPDVLLYFTDGFGSAPSHAPNYPVMWVLTHGGTKPCEWGAAVRFKKGEENGN